MRVSTNGSFQRSLSLMQQIQAALDRTQRQITSGRRILSPSDDPISSARALEIKESLSRLQQFDRNGQIAKNRLSLEESVLANVGNVLQRVRELSIQANNASQSNESRALIAVELEEHLDHLVELANQKDGNGRYLFAGNMDGTAPVNRSGGTFTYNGDQGQRMIQIGDSRQVADGDPGSAVFFRIRDGNGAFSITAAASNTGAGVSGEGSVTDPTQYDMGQYTVRFIDPGNYEVLDSTAAVVSTGTFQPGETIAFRGIEFHIDGQPDAADEFLVDPSRFKDVFSMVADIANAVSMTANDDRSRAVIRNEINTGILDMDQALGKLLDIRTQVGSRLAAIDNEVDNNSSMTLILQSTLADIEDLDYADAISRLSQQASILEAAQQSFVRTQSISLFNLL